MIDIFPKLFYFLTLLFRRTFLTRSAEQGAVLSRPSVTLDCYRLTHQKCYRRNPEKENKKVLEKYYSLL